ncbi:hypothetical protein SH528x_001948 [Novipirellula sp. SH528]|uniref:hypothetical protein n=1 Tax=Novipirellula sp. SH528 TaxID=3454466 RepID=UPI003F9F32E4
MIRQAPITVLAMRLPTIIVLCAVAYYPSSAIAQTNFDPVAEGLAPTRIGQYQYSTIANRGNVSNGKGSISVEYYRTKDGRSDSYAIDSFELDLDWEEASHKSDDISGEFLPNGFGANGRPPLPDQQAAKVRDNSKNLPVYYFFSQTHAVKGSISQINSRGTDPLDKASLDHIANEFIKRISGRAKPYPQQILALRNSPPLRGNILWKVTLKDSPKYGYAYLNVEYMHPRNGKACRLDFCYYYSPSGRVNHSYLKTGNDTVASESHYSGVRCYPDDDSGLSQNDVNQLGRRLLPIIERFAARRPSPTSPDKPTSTTRAGSQPTQSGATDPQHTADLSPSLAGRLPTSDGDATASPNQSLPSINAGRDVLGSENDGNYLTEAEQRARDAAATTILVTLILAGAAAGLNLTQSITMAIADAVRAGIEVTTDNVVDALLDLPEIQNGSTDDDGGNTVPPDESEDPSVSQDPNGPAKSNEPEATEPEIIVARVVQPGEMLGPDTENTEPTKSDSPTAATTDGNGLKDQQPVQPNAPSVPGTLTEGDETIPFRGTRETLDQANRTIFGERGLHGSSTSSLTDDPSVAGSAEPSTSTEVDGSDPNRVVDQPAGSIAPTDAEVPPEGGRVLQSGDVAQANDTQDGGTSQEVVPRTNGDDNAAQPPAGERDTSTAQPTTNDDVRATPVPDSTDAQVTPSPDGENATPMSDPNPVGSSTSTVDSTTTVDSSPETDNTHTAATGSTEEPRVSSTDGSGEAQTVAGSDATNPADTEPINPYTLRDPNTDELLGRDVNGRVKYGDEWMTPEEAKVRIDIDTETLARATGAKQRADDFKTAVDRLSQETDPQRRADLEAEIRRRTTDILGDYDTRSLLKAEGKTPYSAALDGTVQSINRGVDSAHIDDLNAMGLGKDGQKLVGRTLIDFRNASSTGTVPTDRDRGLDEAEYQQALQEMNNAKPGSQEAYDAARRLDEVRRRQKLTLDPEKYQGYLNEKRTAANNQAEQINQQLEALPADSPERAALEQQQRNVNQEIQGLDKREADLEGVKLRHQALQNARIEELHRALAKHPTDSPQAARIRQTIEGIQNQKSIPISKSRFGGMAQESYNNVFEQKTGKNATGALQAVTTGQSVDAYGDAKVLKGVGPDNVPNPDYAAQTASVSNVKATDNQHLVDEGHFTRGQAIKETARGYAKDMATKVLPLVNSDAGITPKRAAELKTIYGVLDAVGKGEILPGQADLKLRQALPDIPNMNMAKATAMVDANFEAAIKWRGKFDPPKMTAGDAFGHVSDLHGTLDEYGKLRGKGANVVDAAGTAALKTATGNVLYANQPGIGMVGALLPEGARKIMPDQFVGELIDTSRTMLGAAASDLGEATVTGEVSGQHFTQAAEEIAKGGGTVGGYGRLGAFAGDEFARAQQQNPDGGIADNVGRAAGNLAGDVYRMAQTGVLKEELIAGKEAFDKYAVDDLRPSALRGEHGTPLRGVFQALDLANEIAIDPQRFADDTQALREEGWVFDRDGNFGNGLAFDPVLQRQVASNVDEAMSGAPFVNTPYTGLRDLGRTVVDPEFRSQMQEGAGGLADEMGEFLFGGMVDKSRSGK